MIDDQLGLPDVELAPVRMAWDADELAYLRANWRTHTAEQIAGGLPLRTRNSVIGMAHRLGLPHKPAGKRPKGSGGGRLRKAYACKGDDVTLSRWVKVGKPHVPRQADLVGGPRVVSPRLLARSEVVAGRTRFPKSITDPLAGGVLVSGHNNAKIGRDVRKGWARGYWIYTLTLEERATCPATCYHWATCYGNNMPFAHRVDHRRDGLLKIAIERDVRRLLDTRGRVGILVRLHALGDFFDPRYVKFWSGLLDRHRRLAVFGYTAWPPDSPVGQAIAEAKERHGRRFAIRWSNGTAATECAVPVRAVDEPVNAVVCPEQTGATAACATCGFCWNSTRNVAFLEH